MTKIIAPLVATLASGCFAPDTLRYQLRDPGHLAVYVDGQAVLDTSDESPRYDSITRTTDDTLASTSFVLQHTPLGLFAKVDTTLPLLHGELLEIVGNDGWVASLPVDVPRRTVAGQAQLTVAPRLTHYAYKHASGYMLSLDAPRTGDHVISLATPRDNVVAVERRGDPDRITFGGFLFGPAALLTLIGSVALATSHRTANRAVGGIALAGGGGLDVVGIYEIVRGLRKKRLQLP